MRCGGPPCCNRDTAFAILRDVSQHRNIKLAAVAAEVIRSVTGTAPAPPHFDPPRWPASPASGAAHRDPFGEL
ncbi:ANTAR domain-containing protein [Nocardia terpenica]|uniref:ANTAR domain-containing protein n=1 Tax=Nocardia terpenica TaxID=455432 RepID=UPI0012FE5D34